MADYAQMLDITIIELVTHAKTFAYGVIDIEEEMSDGLW